MASMMEHVTVTAPDISCAHCVATVKEAVGALPGVASVKGSFKFYWMTAAAGTPARVTGPGCYTVLLYLDVRAGRQIIAWGRADGLNPTDNLTGEDLTLLAPDDDDRRLGTTALRASYYLGDVSVRHLGP